MSRTAGLRWTDTDYRLRPGVWRALVLSADESMPPGLEVQACDPLCLRLEAQGVPLLWARIESDYWGYELLRPRRTESVNVLPPISFDLVHENDARAGANSRSAWARTYAEMLASSEACPIGAGQWVLERGNDGQGDADLSLDMVNTILAQHSNGYVQWDFGDDVYPITLRDISAPDNGRVKAWRKHARAGTLPPVLLYFVSGLDACVVLDGHDRLLAASLERTTAPVLRLQALSDERETRDQAVRDAVLQQVSVALAVATRERARPASERLERARRFLDVDGANRLLLDAFVPLHGARRTRARPVPGGSRRWAAEVSLELHRQKIADTGLLEGLAPS